MGPYTNLLVPVDFTEKNQAAVATATNLTAEQGEVTLLHVIEPIHGSGHQELQQFFAELEQSAREKMSAMARGIDRSGITVHQRIVFGRRGPVIAQFAAENNIDLLVLSSHRIDPKNPLASWGTLSYQVATVAPCPVLLEK